jgi:hypothetical protein
MGTGSPKDTCALHMQWRMGVHLLDGGFDGGHFSVRLKATAASSLRKCPLGRDVELGEELLRVGRREDGFAAGRLAASMRLTGVRKSGEEAKNHVCGQNRLFAGRTTGTTLNEAQTDTKCIMAFRFLITNQTYTCQSKR